MTESQVTLNELFAFASKYLPNDWELTLTMSRTEIDLSLYDPTGHVVVIYDFDQNTAGLVQAYVNAAREREGLPVAWFPAAGLPTTVELVRDAERQLAEDPGEVPKELAEIDMRRLLNDALSTHREGT